MPDFVPYAPTEYRKQRRPSHHKSPIRRKFLFVVVVIFGLQTVVLLVMLSRLFLLVEDKARIEAQAKDLQAQVDSLQPEVKRLQQELNALVSKRLPGLTRLELDKVLPLKQQYLKSVFFTVTGNTRSQRHEFKLVLCNEESTPVQPRVDVLLFDSLGLQVGQCTAGVFEDGSSILSLLEPGETRSFSGEVEVAEGHQAEYFSVRIK